MESFKVTNNKVCKRCGTENLKDAHICYKCGYELKRNIGCFASSITMFLFFHFALALFIFSWVLIALLGAEAMNSPIVVLILLLRFIRVVSGIGAVITLILAITFYCKSKR